MLGLSSIFIENNIHYYTEFHNVLQIGIEIVPMQTISQTEI